MAEQSQEQNIICWPGLPGCSRTAFVPLQQAAGVIKLECELPRGRILSLPFSAVCPGPRTLCPTQEVLNEYLLSNRWGHGEGVARQSRESVGEGL